MTLIERLDAWRRHGRPRGSPDHAASAVEVVDRWQRVIGGNDPSLFESRLAWDDLELRDVIEALSWFAAGPAAAARTSTAFGWSDELEAMFDAGRDEVDDDADRWWTNWACDAGVPFIELWSPWLAGRRTRLNRHPARTRGVVAGGAIDALVTHLARQIGDLASEAVFAQFDRCRSMELSALADRSGNAFYRRWMTDQVDRRLAPLFDEYPVLARQLHRVLRTWTDGSLELLDRLVADHEAIAALVGSPTDPGPVTEIRAGLSDRHHGGRRVAVLVFDSGARVVYKPRSLAAEAAFARLIGDAMADGLEPPLAEPAVVQRDQYGWMEFVERPSEIGPADVSRWFRAAGSLLCLAHVLRASDLHFDNLRVGERSPALIDLETLLHPEPALGRTSPTAGTAASRVADWMRSSFHSTGMLSFLQQSGDGSVIDIGGLCGTGGHRFIGGAPCWVELGTDQLRQSSRPATARTRRNLPRLATGPASPTDYLDELSDGFATTYRFVMERRGGSFDRDRIRRRFEGVSSRVLIRPTEQYARLLRLLIRPACQRDGIAVGLAIEALNRGLIDNGPRPPLWCVVDAERRALTALDVPRFTAEVDGSTLCDGDHPIAGDVLAQTGLDAYEERLHGMSDDDLDRQLRLMVLTVGSLRGAVDHVTQADGAIAEGIDPDSVVRFDAELAAADVRSIADRLVAAAVPGDDGSLTWLDPVHLRPEGRRDHGVAHYLYSGASGIGLFFAAAARAFPGRGYRSVAAGALRSALAVAADPDASTLLANEGLGACHGLGGLIYALTWSGDWLADPGCLEAALRLARHIDADRIAADDALDIEGGAAGAIVGLLALHARTADAEVLAAASACGRHLLAARQPGPDGGAAWPSRQGGLLSGFAHGASGGALALVRLSDATGDGSWLAAAEAALVFENSRFDPATGNWPVDVLDRDGSIRERRNMVAWCHGAPGIALARVLMRDAVPAADRTELLEAAIETTVAAPLTGADHLCCGTLGRVDVLNTIGQLLERDELRYAAESRAMMVIRRAAEQGGFKVTDGSGPARPGLFRGLAGVGYALLRLIGLHPLPSVLGFEATATTGARR